MLSEMTLEDLLVHYDEMGYAPTNLSPESAEQEGATWKAALVDEINKLRDQVQVKDVALELASHRAAIYDAAYRHEIGGPNSAEPSRFTKDYFSDLAQNIVFNKGGTANADS